MEDKLPSVANRIGIGHLCFSVEDVKTIQEKVLENGGHKIGEVVSKDYGSGILVFTYAADPEGNINEPPRGKPRGISG